MAKFKPIIDGVDQAGLIDVIIDGTYYRYRLDASEIPYVQNVWKRSPGKGFNYLKRVSSDHYRIDEGGFRI